VEQLCLSWGSAHVFGGRLLRAEDLVGACADADRCRWKQPGTSLGLPHARYGDGSPGHE
jgi:hypothetical protein